MANTSSKADMLIAQAKAETEMSCTVVSIDTINFVSSILSDAREIMKNMNGRLVNLSSAFQTNNLFEQRDCSLNKEHASC